MSDERRQHELQEYLDGRMSDEERERFERRLAGDEELAGRVAAARDLREALRTDDGTLTGAFYTRTVAEFSARQRRRLPLGLTWGSVGLAAAALAAAAIFVPPMLRDEIPLKPAATEESTGFERNAPVDERLAEDLDLSGETAADAKGDSVDRLEKKQAIVHPRVDPDAGPDDAPADGALAGSRARRQAPPPQEMEPREPAPEPEPVPAQPMPVESELELLTQGKVSPNLRTPPPPPATVGAKNETFRFKDESTAAEGQAAQRAAKESEELKRTTTEISSLVGTTRATEYAAVELPRTAAGAGEVEIFDGDVAQSMLGGFFPGRADFQTTEEDAGRDVARKSKAVVGTRLVVVGAHPGLDRCEDLTVRRSEHAWEVTYRNSGSSIGVVVCGISLPDDGLEVRFEGWRVEP